MSIKLYTNINPILHVLIWILMGVILFSYPSFAYRGAEIPSDFLIKQIVHFLVMGVAYYSNTYLILPYLLYRNKVILFVLSIILFTLAASYLMAFVENLLHLQVQMKHIWGKRNYPKLFDQFGFFTTLITLGISTSISAINKVNHQNRQRLKQEKDKVSMELALLKAQIHPHFLFNSLHSIYALTYTDIEASRAVLTHLSAIMRYLLYETRDDTTTVDKEVTFISHYVAIMKKRLNAETTIDFQIPDEIIVSPIAPMILMPYVENVFKHGISENKNTIAIHINNTAKGIVLTTRNRIAEKSASVPEAATGGIGMQNTQRRLELLYKNRYALATRVIADTNEFELTLQLDL